jgi:hypothetical protein
VEGGWLGAQGDGVPVEEPHRRLTVREPPVKGDFDDPFCGADAYHDATYVISIII